MQDNLQTDLRNDPAPANIPMRRHEKTRNKPFSLIDKLILAFVLLEIILVVAFIYHYYNAIRVS